MARQPHPEVNFRLGKGLSKERRRALSPTSLLKTMRWLGMSDEEIKAKLLTMRQAYKESMNEPGLEGKE